MTRLIGALVLLALAFPVLATAARNSVLAVAELSAAHTAGTLTVAAVVLLLRATPTTSRRLLTWLAGAWLARLVLARTAHAEGAK